MVRRRGFGEVERRVSATGKVSYRARYAMADGTRYSRTVETKLDAEAWLAAERARIDRDEWSPPKVRQAAEERRRRDAASNTVGAFAQRYLAERGLRPRTVHSYRQLLRSRILPWFQEVPLVDVTLTEIKRWRSSLPESTAATNAAAYRLLRSVLQAAEEEELIERAPPKIRGAGSAPARRVARPATLEEIAVIAEAMPERLRVFVMLAAFVGFRQSELLELRRSDVDGVAGTISISRAVDKDVLPNARNPCPSCGRGIGPPKTASGTRTVHVPPPLMPMLQRHLLEHTALGPDGLLFPGDRTDHMSVRYLMDHFREAREAAGRPDLTVHHLRHTALTMAGQHGATAAELQARAGHASHAAMAIYQHATLDRDKLLADQIGATYQAWAEGRSPS